jgi:CelD/BcsL family acetyltransferase involved in cellulose biosynthesis
VKPEEQQKEENHSEYLDGSAAVDLSGIQAWDHPESNWNVAAMQTPQIDPFCCRTEWQLSYHEAMEPHRELLVREVPGSMVALAELEVPSPGRVLGPLESSWFFGCPLLGPDAVELLDDLLGEFEPQVGMPAPRFAISGLAPRGELRRKLTKKLGSRFDFRLVKSDTLCNASLEGGLDGFLSRRSAKHRRGLGKQVRRATGEGVTFERHAPTDPAEATQIYARMLAVEEASWKGIGLCGMTVGSARVYYDCMLRRLSASGDGRVMFARHGERDIGFIFGGLAGSVYRGQQFSYAEDWKSFSIGNLLQLEQIRWLCEENIVRYDMGPLMEYKEHWTENRYQTGTLVLQHKRPRKDL